jgi:hypothetical protein
MSYKGFSSFSFFVLLGIFLMPFFCSADTIYQADTFDEYGADTTLVNGSANWLPFIGSSLNNYSLNATYYSSPPKGLSRGGNWTICPKLSSSISGSYYVSYKIKKVNSSNDGASYNININTALNSTCNYSGDSSNYYYATFIWGSSTCYIGLVSYHNGSPVVLANQEVGCPTSGSWGYFVLDKSLNRGRVCMNGDCSAYATLSDDFVVSNIQFRSGTDSIVLDDFAVTSYDPAIVNGVCGSDDGQILSTPPINFCFAGTQAYLMNTATGWEWECLGINGGITAFCSAEEGLTADGGVCGSDDGQILSSAPTNFCANGELSSSTYIATASGWSWDCVGTAGGSMSHCSATNSSQGYPTLPEEEDCSSYSIPDSWICALKNLLMTGIFPSQSKVEQLQQVWTGISTKAPLNYLGAMQEGFGALSIHADTIQISIFGNEGDVDLSGWGDVLIYVKRGTTLFVVIAFVAWAIAYIKHFF